MRKNNVVGHLGAVRAVSAISATALLGLAGCSTDADESTEEALSPGMGNAQAVASPPAADVDGEVIALADAVANATDLAVAGDVIAIRGPETVAVGTVDDFRGGSATLLDIDPGCGELTASGDEFILACNGEVVVIDAQDAAVTEAKQLADGHPATTAVKLTSGEIVTANDSEAAIMVYRGEDAPQEVPAEAPTTQLAAVNVLGAGDAVVRSWAEDTTLQQVEWEDGENGARLRVGLGIGRVAPGVDGMFVVSDTTGDQIAIYTADDVIRLQQTAPVGDSPWAIAWDEVHRLVWVATTGDNALTSYAISQGVPEERDRYNSVANAKNIGVLDDGTVVAVSETGDGLQVLG